MSFNAHTIKLQGRHLIEASAGTGKTYSIANLFLRFLVEPHPANANLPLTVEQILVVTFTNAAADELRSRIRSKVEAALTYMQTGESPDNFIKEFLSQFTDDPQKICYSLYQALLCIDEAAIYTIHSFAVRTVKMFMFETGAYADIKVAIGGDADKERLIKNLWRELQWLNLGEKPAVFTDFSSFYGYFSKQHQAEIKPQLVANTLDDLLNSNMAWQQNEALGWANYVKAFLLTLLNNRLAHYEKAVLQPDDVIALINAKLAQEPGGTLLRQALQKRFPVCLVDECQDTDPEQFRLFNTLYNGQGQEGLYIIGDPKQSIYAFRGADIFSYLAVKQALPLEHIHTLDTNYRSTAGIMQGVNALFGEQESGTSFMYKGIDYAAIDSCESSDKKLHNKGQLIIANEHVTPFVFIGSKNYDTFNNMLPEFANDAAERIVSLLNQQAYIKKNGQQIPLHAGDITVLVREHKEALAIKKALAKRQLLSVYLSQKDSVLVQCAFAQDILFVLKAIAEPSDKRALKAAYATLLLRGFSEDFTVLKNLEEDDYCFEQLIAQFTRYQQLVHYRGVLAAFNQIFNDVELALAFSKQENSDRLMTDFRHLGELLQKEYNKTNSLERLIEWYQQQLIDDSDIDGEEKSQRLESDAQLIQIVTLHGCKGLEYKVVFIPFFFAGTKDTSYEQVPLLHQPTDDNGFKAVIDFSLPSADVKASIDYEAQAESIRLLYVGITRAIYQCFVGIANTGFNKQKTPKFSSTPWAYLLSVPSDKQTLKESLFNDIKEALADKLQQVNYSYEEAINSITPYQHGIEQSLDKIVAALPTAHLPQSSWLISSYSSLASQKEHVAIKTTADDESLGTDAPLLAINHLSDAQWQDDIRFSLERSNRTGDCLHGIFEDIAQAKGEYDNTLLEHHLRLNGLLANIDETAITAKVEQLATFIKQLLHQPLSVSDNIPSLAVIFKQGSLPELNFDFGIASSATSISINHINQVLVDTCQTSAHLARRDGKLNLQGIMNGSIDLLFIYNKKIYVLDYKSNTLGASPAFYHQAAMQASMTNSQYDVQYYIYSVAAHRYMQQRLADRYQFDNGEYQFGGVFYLYLRGLGCEAYGDNGIYYTRPSYSQIKALDNVFLGIKAQVAV